MKFCPNNRTMHDHVIGALLYPRSTGRGYTVLPLSVRSSQDVHNIFLSNNLWQQSDIWSLASEGSIESRKPVALSMVKSGRSPIRWRERHQQQMKISSDLGNTHTVTIDQLVMPAVELLEGWPQPKICLQITQILHKVNL